MGITSDLRLRAFQVCKVPAAPTPALLVPVSPRSSLVV